MSEQNKIVKERLQYHFSNPNGEWNIPNDMPFMKEFLNEVKKLCEEKECEWKHIDFGMMGFNDYEYVTSCGKHYDCDKISKENFCPNCGGKIK